MSAAPPLRAILLAGRRGEGSVAECAGLELRASARVDLRELSPPDGARRAVRRRVSEAAPDVVLVVVPDALVTGCWLKTLGWRVVAVHPPSASTGAGRLLIERFLDGAATVGENRLTAVAAAAAGRPGAGLADGPAVSVVSTVLDEEGTVNALVARVTAQLRDDDELVVVDGGSRDRTLAQLRAWAERDPRVRLKVAPGTNISAARNAGVRCALRDVIACTDAGCTPAGGWLEALRAPFAEDEPPGLVAGNPGVRADTVLQRAQALGCYPDPDESERPDAAVRVYGKLFGLVFDPTLPFARSMAFSRAAWQDAGGFPEAVRWTEDGVFGRAVSRRHRCVFAKDARVTWEQHPSWRATARMYHRYGRGAAESGDRQLQFRDGIRACGYAAAGGLLWWRGRSALPWVLAGGAAYVSLPLRRVVRHRAGWRTALAIPIAMATKDLAKVAGEASTRLSARRRRA